MEIISPRVPCISNMRFIQKQLHAFGLIFVRQIAQSFSIFFRHSSEANSKKARGISRGVSTIAVSNSRSEIWKHCENVPEDPVSWHLLVSSVTVAELLFAHTWFTYHGDCISASYKKTAPECCPRKSLILIHLLTAQETFRFLFT